MALIISFCNKSYIDLAFYWLKFFRKLNIDNYLIVAADEFTFNALSSKDIKTQYIKPRSDNFWVYRNGVIKEFLDKGIDIVHSDLDAIWRKNILDEIIDNDEIDLYISQGTIYPSEAVKKHGFVLCCGFFYIRSKPETRGFFDNFIKTLDKIGDDQIALNRLLLDSVYGESIDLCLSKSYKVFKTDLIGYNLQYKLKICLISMLKIQREYFDNEGYIYHLLSPKDSTKKLQLFNKILHFLEV